MSLRASAAAVVDAVKTYGGVTAYGIGDVPDNPPYPYVVMSVLRRTPPGTERRLNFGSDLTGFRAISLFVGSTANEARWVEEKTWQALEDRRLLIDGVTSSPCMYWSARAVERDPDVDRLYTGTAEWTFVV